jgi:rhodanese-related sulfurtransferase
MNTTLRAGVLLASLLLVAGCASPSQATPTSAMSFAPPGPTEVSVSDAASMRADGAFMLDVREPDEWAAGHIPGATLIPLGQLAGRIAEVPRDRMVVTVCRSGNRSAQARDILRAAGFEAVASMAGGMNDWVAANLEIVTGP